MPNAQNLRPVLTGLVLAACCMLASTAEAQIASPARPVADFKNSAGFGLSYGANLNRDATFWGWSAEYSRKIGAQWFTAASLMWDEETEDVDGALDRRVESYTVAATISYSISENLAVTTGLGKGFADTNNQSRSIQWSNGDWSTGVAVAWSTPGLKHWQRDSIGFSVAYEYNITQDEFSLSFDIAFGWSF